MKKTQRMDYLNKAFTLAEVLITLVIIGVVAAITVPVVMNNTNNEETVTKLKKAFSTFSQATDQIMMEEGNASSWAKNTDTIYKLYKKRLNVIKDCEGDLNAGCFASENYKFLNGTASNATNYDSLNGYRRFVLSDGVSVGFWSYVSPTCAWHGDGSTDVCTIIHVDINGKKKPNTLGRDMFLFVLKDNGLYPMGCDEPEDNNACVKSDGTKSPTGYGCACKVIYEGKIDY